MEVRFLSICFCFEVNHEGRRFLFFFVPQLRAWRIKTRMCPCSGYHNAKCSRCSPTKRDHPKVQGVLIFRFYFLDSGLMCLTRCWRHGLHWGTREPTLSPSLSQQLHSRSHPASSVLFFSSSSLASPTTMFCGHFSLFLSFYFFRHSETRTKTNGQQVGKTTYQDQRAGN